MMYANLLLLFLSSLGVASIALACPEDACSNTSLSIYPPKICDSGGLMLKSLFNFTYEQNMMVELLGPSEPIDSAAIIIAAPHGGYKKLTDALIPPRSCASCITTKDSYTLDIAMALGQSIIDNYCKVPYIVVNYVHRSKVDVNREIVEAAQGNPLAEAIWKSFHDFIAEAQVLVQSQHGTVIGDTGLEGIKGLLFDVHGYSGKDWYTLNGAPFIQWGYRLSKDTLDPNRFCPLDVRSGTIGSLSHGRHLPGQSLECLVRGGNSLASRLNSLLPIDGSYGSNGVHCGIGLPSLEFPSPKAASSNPFYCEKTETDPSKSCHYYSGGYDINVHEHLDWDADIHSPNSFAPGSNIMMNAIQAEIPRCIRFASGSQSRKTVHSKFAKALSTSICSFIIDLYGDSSLC